MRRPGPTYAIAEHTDSPLARDNLEKLVSILERNKRTEKHGAFIRKEVLYHMWRQLKEPPTRVKAKKTTPEMIQAILDLHEDRPDLIRLEIANHLGTGVGRLSEAIRKRRTVDNTKMDPDNDGLSEDIARTMRGDDR